VSKFLSVFLAADSAQRRLSICYVVQGHEVLSNDIKIIFHHVVDKTRLQYAYQPISAVRYENDKQNINTSFGKMHSF
jgi:hypothetical protein